jgi:protein phosphatase
MSQPKPQICCPNANCTAPLNPLGSSVCGACGTPLIYRYLLAVGKFAEQIPATSQVGGRYYVTARRIWLDTQPSLPPDVPADWSDAVLPYLYLYPYRLHIPEVYGFCIQNGELLDEEIFLLDNVPLDPSGILYPAIAEAWTTATAVRQVYWLWQVFQLWQPLAELGVATSLLAADNIRVEGWRVRLCQLYHDTDVLAAATDSELALGLADLSNLWLSWVDSAKPELIEPLRSICRQMQAEAEPGAIAAQLNQLLLEQAAQLPLNLKVAGGTDTGPEREHNEDACYPLTLNQPSQVDGLIPRVAIVCDGIGGHEGGEVASQIAVQSLKPQMQALLSEIADAEEPVAPELVMQQLESAVRVVNNLIASQNDAQQREDRRRMGTTLVMAIQLPQRVKKGGSAFAENGHELYLVHVGDSRAYWLTQRHCYALTVDDNVVTREVRTGRALYHEGIHRPDAGALTQALGTRDADFIHPTIQRFILEENGLLLLCSDGVSDNGLIERTWAETARAVLNGKMSLDTAVRTWLDLANQHNGYDNSTIALLHCHVSSPSPEVLLPQTSDGRSRGSEWSTASQSLRQEGQEVTGDPTQTKSSAAKNQATKRALLFLGAIVLLVLVGGLGIITWSRLDPGSFQRFRERLIPLQRVGKTGLMSDGDSLM